MACNAGFYGDGLVDEKGLRKMFLIYKKHWKNFIKSQFSSVTQSCPLFVTPWIAARQASLSIPSSRSLLKLMSIKSVMSSSLSSSVVPFSSCPQSLPASGSFPMSQLFMWGGQSIGVSGLASVLIKNISWQLSQSPPSLPRKKKQSTFQVVLVVKNSPANTADKRDVGSIPGSERSPGGRHGNPLQYCCLENHLDRGD